MKIYIAASMKLQDEMALLANHIEVSTKHTVVSRWHGRTKVPVLGSTVDSKICAERDIEDIKSADLMVSIGEARSSQGGRFVEFGMAWAWNIPIVHLGERENVFHYLEGIRIVPNRGALLDVLRDYYKDVDHIDEVVTNRIVIERNEE